MYVVIALAFVAVASADRVYTSCGQLNPNIYGEPCRGHGECFVITVGNRTEAVCKCDPEYAGETCGERRRPQLLVFLMSLFFGGYGVDRFIMGLTRSAIAKLILNILFWVPALLVSVLGLLVSACVLPATSTGAKILSGLTQSAAVCTGLVFAGLCFGWWLHDVILFGMNRIHDINGNSPYAW